MGPREGLIMATDRNSDIKPAQRTSPTAKEIMGLVAAIVIFGLASAFLVPRGPSRSMYTQSEANMDNVAKSLAWFAAQKGNVIGYPPAYGYLKPEATGRPVESLTDSDHVLEPYTATTGIHAIENVYQVPQWAMSFDNSGDGKLGLMEYLPVGVKASSGEDFIFSTTLYTGENTPRSGDVDEVAAQLEADRLRPYAYVPYNIGQLKAARAYWTARGDALGESFDRSDPFLATLTFPPDTYDAFVLIGSGPGGNDGGLTGVDPPGIPGVDYDKHYVYHWLGLRIAFLATRDWTGGGTPDESASPQPDQLLDFDFQDRKHATHPCQLPDGTNGHGAMIKVVQ